MASSLDFVVYACDQMRLAGDITYKKMFGEYGIYCNGKIFGLICDNQVYIKPTAVAETMLPNAERLAPYKGAKPHIVLEDLEDSQFLGMFIAKTCDELPSPKPKKKKEKA